MADACIVICTRDGGPPLEACLRAVGADRSAIARECVVVDNGPTTAGATVVARLARSFPMPLRSAREPVAGHCRARNRGIDVSDADLVLFADDDTRPRDGWADALAAPFADDDAVAFVGGRVIPVWPTRPPSWLRPDDAILIALSDWGSGPVDVDASRLPYGANMALRRRALEASAVRFDPRLGHTGRVSMGTDEWHIMRQLLGTHRGAYAPEAVVEHRFATDRIDRAAVRRRWYQAGFGTTRSQQLLAGRAPVGVAAFVRAAQLWRRAARLRRAHDRLPALTPEQTAQEFLLFTAAGMQIERAVGRARPLADRLAGMPV